MENNQINRLEINTLLLYSTIISINFECYEIIPYFVQSKFKSSSINHDNNNKEYINKHKINLKVYMELAMHASNVKTIYIIEIFQYYYINFYNILSKEYHIMSLIVCSFDTLCCHV